MASMTITVADSQVTRVLNAIWGNAHGGALPPSQAAAAQFAREWLYERVKSEVKGYEAAVAARAITERADDPLDAQKQ